MKKQIIHLIRNGYTIKECALDLDISRSKLYRLLDQWQLTKKDIQFNESFFEEINTEEKAYWLGFIMADGCVSVTQYPKVQIKLHIKDELHLIKWHKSIRSCNKLSTIVGKFKQSTHYSSKMCNDLIELGCVPNKSLLLKFPKLQEDLQHHLIRGYFDGDGCVSFSTNRKIGFIGTKQFLISVHDILQQNECLRTNGWWGVAGQAFRWEVHGNKITQRVIDYMYNNATIYLDRKKERCHDSLRL
ncbi:MAG: hypothetical protein ACXAC5_11790 [Promethearchaeota archaeon]|jgi:intein-encoded DNA endonuclease-like protein